MVGARPREGGRHLAVIRLRGGLPAWVQHEARDEAGFLFMLDFDRIHLDDAWEDAGLAGCLFVFADPDGQATAFWQYT